MKIISTLFYAVFVTLIVGIAGLLIATMLPIPGNIEMKIVKSGSMEPAIPTGSIVVVKPQVAYSVGDVITFGKDTKVEIPTTHRIIASAGEGAGTTYTTKGDANEEQDPKQVALRDVIGRVIFHAPYVGFILDFARQPMGFALLIAVPAGLVILEEVLTIVREARNGWRRRRDGGGDAGGTSAHEEANRVQMVYTKRRSMDEIFVPMLVEIENAGVALARTTHALRYGLNRDSYGMTTALVMGIIFMTASSQSLTQGTIAYFQDIETSIGNIFQAGRWDEVGDPQDIVLNEFLPRPDGVAYGFDFGNDGSNMPQGEWIELYNNGDLPVDVLGWYMTDASGGVGNTHAVITAGNTQPAGTVIPPHGWLVVYLNKPSLNNTTDSIFLYTSTSTGSILVDTVAYAQSDFCFLEPTPTEENSTTSPTGTPGNGNSADCNQALVPPNKTYARIPDGTGAWVDPIPTPGSGNIVEVPLAAPVMQSADISTAPVEEAEGDDVLGESYATEEEPDELSQPEGSGGGGSATPPADSEPVEEWSEAQSETDSVSNTPGETSNDAEPPADESSGADIPPTPEPTPEPVQEISTEVPPSESTPATE